MKGSETIKNFVKEVKAKTDEASSDDLGVTDVGFDSVLAEGFRELTSNDKLYYKAILKKGLAFEFSRGEVYSSLVGSEVMTSLINNIRRNSMSVDGRGRDDIIKMATAHTMSEEGFDEGTNNALVGAIARGLGK